MKKLVIILLLLFSTVGMAQDWQFNGTKYPNATNVGDTVSLQTHIPIIDSQGLLNYYLPAGDLLGLNTTVTWENITGDQGAVNISGFFNDAGYLTTETDPTVGSHIKAITTGDINTWDSALQTEIDPTVPAHVKGITTTNISTWNSALQSGDGVSELNNDANYTTLATTDTRYLRSDISDDNGVNELTLGGLKLPSIPVGLSTYDHLVVNPTTGAVSRIQLGTFDFGVGDGTTNQFNVNSTTPELNFVGSGDTSVSFDGTTNTVTITSIPGAGGGGAVTSFEGRDGAVVSQAGDYNTGQVNELGNLYFTEPRVRSTTLTGFATGANTSITATDNILQAFGKVQGQLNGKISDSYTGFDSRYVETTGDEIVSGVKTWTGRNEFNSGFFSTGVNSLFSQNGTRINFEARNEDSVASLHKFIQQGGSYTPYFERWYNGSIYQKVGVDGTDLTINGFKVWNTNTLRSDSQNDARYVINANTEIITGLKTFTGGSGRIDLDGAAPQIRMTQIDANVDEKNYIFIADGSRFDIRLYNDAFNSFNSVFQINRLGNVANEIVLNTTNTNVLGTLHVTGASTITNDLTLSNSGRLRLGSNFDIYDSAGGVAAINLRTSNLILYDNFSPRFIFNRTTGNFQANGDIVANGGTSINWNTAYGWGNHASAGYVPNTRTVLTGAGLAGGGNLTANRTLSFDTTWGDNRYVKTYGNETISGAKDFAQNITFNSGFSSTGINNLYSPNGTRVLFEMRNETTDGSLHKYIQKVGGTYNSYYEMWYNGGQYQKVGVYGTDLTINGFKVWNTNTLRSDSQNDARYALSSRTVVAGIGMSGGGSLTGNVSLSLSDAYGGSTTVGAVRYNGTTKAAGRFYGGSDNPTNTHRLNYDGNLYVNNLTAMGGMTATGNIVSDSNIQASGAIITGAGIFTGRVSGADAVNDNEFVTRRQVAPIAASGSGLARLAGANTAMVSNTVTSGYYTEGGTTFSVNIPAGTFSDNVHLGALTIDLNAALTYTGATTTGTEDYSMDMVFIQGSTVDRIPFYVTSIPRVSKLGYLTYRMTAISRSSAGIFMISGGGNQYPSGAPFMEPYTLNIDARQAFTIRIRKGSTGSDTNMDVDIASFVVTTMDGGAQ